MFEPLRPNSFPVNVPGTKRGKGSEAMAGKFEVYKGKDGFRWRLKAGNGEIVATGESYPTKAGAIKGTEAVQRAAASASVVDKTD
jgi:uncharacterized protein